MTSSLFLHKICLAFWSPGPSEMMLILVVALLLYGGKLPEVARSWGKTFAEFRRNLNGIQNEINDMIYEEPAQLEYYGEDLLPEEYNQETEEESTQRAQDKQELQD